MGLELLVDAGSTYTWVKRDRLEALGIKPSNMRRFKTIDGRVIERMSARLLSNSSQEGYNYCCLRRGEGGRRFRRS